MVCDNKLFGCNTLGKLSKILNRPKSLCRAGTNTYPVDFWDRKPEIFFFMSQNALNNIEVLVNPYHSKYRVVTPS
jgi:hypothetical protein